MGFNCTSCGLCCMHIDKLIQDDMLFTKQRKEFPYKHDKGVCEKFDRQTKLCTIYDSRPEICRVTEMYKHFPMKVGIEAFYALTEKGCRKLQDEELKRTVGIPAVQEASMLEGTQMTTPGASAQSGGLSVVGDSQSFRPGLSNLSGSRDVIAHDHGGFME